MDRVFCKICKERTPYSRRTFARYHLKNKHGLTSEQYYTKFNKKGTCKTCGKTTKFYNIKIGFADYCSGKCSLADNRKHCNPELFRSEEFKARAKITKITKYGDENYCNVGKIKHTKKIRYGSENYCNPKEIKRTKLKRYGSENYVNLDKMKDTLRSRYGVDNFSRSTAFRKKMEKIRNWVPLGKLSEYKLYRKEVKSETGKWKTQLFESWDGLCYYTKEVLITSAEWKIMHPDVSTSRNKLQPTIDHKIPIAFGFVKNIDPKIIGGMENLCICSRHINTKKNGVYSNKQWKGDK